MEKVTYESIRPALVGLIIADLLLKYEGLTEDDTALCRDGVDLAWKWLAGEEVDPYQLCEYVDGDTNLPIRSIEYGNGTLANSSISAAFLAIGLIASKACEEAGKMPTESVENFGPNEQQVLLSMADALEPKERSLLREIQHAIDGRWTEQKTPSAINRVDFLEW